MRFISQTIKYMLEHEKNFKLIFFSCRIDAGAAALLLQFSCV